MEPLTLGLLINERQIRDEVQTAIQDLPVRVVLDQPDVADWTALLEKLDRLRPEVLLVEITATSLSLEEAVNQIKSVPTPPMIVVLHRSADPELVLATLRAGAQEYLCPPLGDGLRKALERLSGERAKQKTSTRPSGKAFAFLSAKGGCGATTIACHAAAEVARQAKQQVLLADFDLEAGLVGFLMKAKSTYSVLDAAKNINRLDLSFWKALISNGTPHLEVLSAPAELAPMAHANPEQVRNVLRFARSHYDWAIVDLGRSLSLLSMHVLNEIDQAFVVSTVELLALHQAKQIAQALFHSGFARDRLHLILNRVPKRPTLSAEEVENLVGLPLHSALPDGHSDLYSAYAQGELLPPTTELGKYMQRLGAKLTGIEPEKSKSKFRIFG